MSWHHPGSCAVLFSVALALGGGCSRPGGQGGPAAAGGGGGAAGVGACAGGSVAFVVDAPDRTGWFVVDSGHDCQPPNWLAIYDQAGQELAIGNPDLHCCIFPNCSTCSFEEVACDNAWQTDSLPANRTWQGTMFPKGGNCGTSTCVSGEVCAPQGHYTAHMCAHHWLASGGPVLGQPLSCVDVPFDLPASGTVVGMLPP